METTTIKSDSFNLEVEEQLKRILSSATFNNSRILSCFLQFVVGETLAGREQEIKEYTIAVHVLSRNIDFNPQLDSIVRINAGRLRRALKEYYHEIGTKDPLLIEIPKGNYIPLFHWQETENLVVNSEKVKPTRKKPAIAVLPFRNISNNASRDFFADGLGDQLSTELSRFHNLSVISYYSSRHVAGKTSDVKEAAMLLGAQYILTGSIQSDNKHLRISAQLISGSNGELLWVRSFERSNTASGLFEIQNEITRSILTAIGGYYGAINRDVMRAPYNDQEDGMGGYDAIFWYYHYQKVFTAEVYQKAISALEAAVKTDPSNALAWAMLGELYMDNQANEFTKLDNPLEEGLKCTQRAVALDPNGQHGYMSQAWCYLFHHNKEECLKSADRAVAINPNSADTMGALGFVLICAGEFEKGFAWLNDSVLNNPFFPWWFNVGFALYFLLKKNYGEALHWAEQIDRPEILWDPMLRACALGHLDRTKEALKNLELLKQLVPDAGNHVKDIIESFLLSQEVNNEILGGLQKAGLAIGYQKP